MKIPVLSIVAGVTLALTACSSVPPQPAWRLDAQSALAGFTAAYLAGDSAAARSDFTRVRAQASGTGDPVAVAQIELLRCATQAASLDLADCSGFTALAPDATAAQRAYADYLAGRWQALDVTLLPQQQRGIPAGAAITTVSDPLSRLVAAGASLNAGKLTPEGIASALDTASTQGWRRPLLAWLAVSIRRADALGDTQEAARLRRRVALAQP